MNDINTSYIILNSKRRAMVSALLILTIIIAFQ